MQQPNHQAPWALGFDYSIICIKSIVQVDISSCVAGSVRLCMNVDGVKIIFRKRANFRSLLLKQFLLSGRTVLKRRNFIIYWFTFLNI